MNENNLKAAAGRENKTFYFSLQQIESFLFHSRESNIYTYFKNRRRTERRMAVVERKLHDRKELWFPYFVCKNSVFFAWR